MVNLLFGCLYFASDLKILVVEYSKSMKKFHSLSLPAGPQRRSKQRQQQNRGGEKPAFGQFISRSPSARRSQRLDSSAQSQTSFHIHGGKHRTNAAGSVV